MEIDTKLIDQLLARHGHKPEDIAGENRLQKQLTKVLLERAMQAETADHLGYEKHDPVVTSQEIRAMGKRGELEIA